MISKSTLHVLRQKHLCLFPDDVKRLARQYYLSCNQDEDQADLNARIFQGAFERYNRNIISVLFEFNNVDLVHFILKNTEKSENK